MKVIGKSIEKLVRPIAMGQGFADARVLTHWSAIVGADMAAHMRPLSLKNGVLQLAVANSAWAMKATFQAPMLMATVNSYFGFQAVKRITTVQSYFTPTPPKVEATPEAPSAEAMVWAKTQAAGMKNETLRKAAEKLLAATYPEQTDRNAVA